MPTTRRTFLAGAAASATLAGLGRTGLPAGALAPAKLPADPARSGIDHIVVLMMENRSFDHALGWLPHADGRQEGLSYIDREGRRVATHHLTDYQGCDHPDPDHSYEGGRIQLNGGRCDGFLLSGQNDEFAVGYYREEDLAFTGPAAREWTTFDRYFSATMAETYPNRFYQHAAATDRTHNSFDISVLPTIWDRLAAAGRTGRYYFSDVPFVALWGPTYLPIARGLSDFLTDCATGNLPDVSFLDPKFLDEGSGTSMDDHPHADIRAGQWFMNQVYAAVTSGPAWERTALFINYDEWGGFYDHVAPATLPDARPDLGTGLRGFRVPCLAISPRARRHAVAHADYDHTSILRFIEWRFGLAPLTPRDKAVRNIGEAFDFTSAPNLDAPRWPVPPPPPGACPPVETEGKADWQSLRSLATTLGFPAPQLIG